MTWTGLTLYNNDGLQSFAIQFPRNVKRLGRLRCAELESFLDTSYITTLVAFLEP